MADKLNDDHYSHPNMVLRVLYSFPTDKALFRYPIFLDIDPRILSLWLRPVQPLASS